LAWLWPAFSVDPPATVTVPKAVVVFSSWYAPGFLTSPETKKVLPRGTTSVSPSPR
jgi:hypothetical protein